MVVRLHRLQEDVTVHY